MTASRSGCSRDLLEAEHRSADRRTIATTPFRTVELVTEPTASKEDTP